MLFGFHKTQWVKKKEENTTLDNGSVIRETPVSGLILGLHPANEKQRYFVTLSLIGWAQT